MAKAKKVETIEVPVQIPAARIREIIEHAGVGYWADRYERTRGGGLRVREASPHGYGYPEVRAVTIVPEDWAAGLALLAQVAPTTFAHILEDNTDAYTGDALVQCCAFPEQIRKHGRLVYG